MRPCIRIAVGAWLCGLSSSGCQTVTPVPPVDRLRQEIALIRQEAHSDDPTVRVCLVICAPRGSSATLSALSALNEPEMLYMATFRFVLVILGNDQITLKHRDVEKRYRLAPDKPYFGYDFIIGTWGYHYYTPGDREQLLDYLTGPLGVYRERLVVADLQLNLIEYEEQPFYAPSGQRYPELIRKYGQYSKADYDLWLKRRSG